MKKLLVLSLTALTISFAATAQTDRTVAPTEKQHRGHANHDKQKMAKELGLTADQKAKLKAQHDAMKAKREALKAQDNLTVKEMKIRKEALKKEQQEQMAAILTPEQKTKMEALKKEKMANRGKGHKGQKGNIMADKKTVNPIM